MGLLFITTMQGQMWTVLVTILTPLSTTVLLEI